jgi:hypothetical protein
MFRKLAFTVLLTAITVPAFADHRERIAQGVRSGELTRPETRRIVRGEIRLHRHERIARSDGIVTPGERYRLERNADRMSARIYRQKHDPQSRF